MVDALNAPRHLDLERETEVVPHVGELGFKETPAAADAHDAPDPNEVAEQIATLGLSPDYLLTIWDWTQERILLKCKAYAG